MNLGEIATQLYIDEFSGTSGAPSVESISGWLSGNVGQLNAVIYTDFSYTGDFPQEESVIFKTIYLRDFYKREAGKALRGIIGGTATNLLLSVKEGDSEIRFTNRNEVSKTLNSVSAQYAEEAQNLITAYNLYAAFPRQVAGNDDAYPENIYESFSDPIREQED